MRQARLALGLLSVLVPVAAAQRAPDPLPDDAEARPGLVSDPYHNGTLIGLMHRPHGKLRRVVWFLESGFNPLPSDPPGCERRVVQVFDDQGRCVELEQWSMGLREARKILRKGKDEGSEEMVVWEDRRPPICWKRELRRDREGVRVEQLRLPMQLDGKTPTGEPASAWWDQHYDSQRRLVRDVGYAKDNVWLQREWGYDDLGRVDLHLRTDCAFGPTSRTSYEYDAEGRVQRTTTTGMSWPAPVPIRSEYEYDGVSRRLVRQRRYLGDFLNHEQTYHYDDEGALIARVTLELLVDPLRGRKRPQVEVETFAGEDRPLTSDVYELGHGPIRSTRFKYEDDDRGNWVRKAEYTSKGSGQAIRRTIEYAD